MACGGATCAHLGGSPYSCAMNDDALPTTPKPEPWHRRVPAHTMAIWLVLIGVLFFTRNRWEAWVAYEEVRCPPHTPPPWLGWWDDPTGRGRYVAIQADNAGHLIGEDPGNPIVLIGHEDRLNSSTFSLDGAKVMTGSGDGAARIWDAETGACLAMLGADAGEVHAGGFSADGRLVSTIHEDSSVRVWHVSRAACVAVMRGHVPVVKTARFSPDGRRLVTASLDGTARIWNVPSGDCMMVLRGHAGSVADAAFSRDGRRIVTGGFDRTARVWDAATGRCLGVMHHGFEVSDVGFAPGDEHLVTLADALRRWRVVRPPEWWGVLWLPHFWLIAALSLVLAWSVRRDMVQLARSREHKGGAQV